MRAGNPPNFRGGRVPTSPRCGRVPTGGRCGRVPTCGRCGRVPVSPAPPDRLSRASLGRIQRSLLVLSLDSPVVTTPSGRGPEGVAAQVLHGGGAGANSANRWWDKTLQVGGVTPEGRGHT